ncbi:MAG: hypothetical protein PHG85_06555 [Candidatus Altiarchaeota archaeon]|nr:hypothetical protein [Candidatus Altiarchaeota archaeon]
MEREEEKATLVNELAALLAEEALAGGENPKREIEKLVSESVYGPGAASKRVNVRWGGLFARGECPSCSNKIERRGEEYVCESCGIKIPADVFDRAREQHVREADRRERELHIQERMKALGLTEDEVRDVYDRAMDLSDATGGTKGEA